MDMFGYFSQIRWMCWGGFSEVSGFDRRLFWEKLGSQCLRAKFLTQRRGEIQIFFCFFFFFEDGWACVAIFFLGVW